MVFTIPPPRSMNGIDTRFVARSRCADISNPWSCLYCTKTASIQRVCIHHTFIHGRSWPDRQLHGTLVLAIYKCENEYLLECGDGGSWFSNGTRAPWMTKKCHRALLVFLSRVVGVELSWLDPISAKQNRSLTQSITATELETLISSRLQLQPGWSHSFLFVFFGAKTIELYNLFPVLFSVHYIHPYQTSGRYS